MGGWIGGDVSLCFVDGHFGIGTGAVQEFKIVVVLRGYSRDDNFSLYRKAAVRVLRLHDIAPRSRDESVVSLNEFDG